MENKRVLVYVPELIRDCLHPYVEIFETIVVPMIKNVPLGMINKSMAKQLHGKIAEFENRKGENQHSFLIYYGLMLCCMYSSQEYLKNESTNHKSKKLNTIAKARTLICIAYQHHAYELIPFML
jgi:hypothetical protein